MLCILFLTATSALGAADALHASWNALLTNHVDKAGRVNYEGFASDEHALDSYLATLATVDLDALSRDEQLALWINAYNAFTIKLILNHYPLDSIRDISRPWKRREWTVAGKKRSLDEMEHDILRGDFKEPRIHFAIVCASIGCPKLSNRAFRADRIDEQLDAAARQFIQSPNYVRVEEGNRGNQTVLRLSRIFDWFEGDFTDDGKQTVTEFVRKYADKATAKAIDSAGTNLKTEYLSYDWRLNKQP